METTDKIVRPELVERLVERDGNICQHPNCGEEIDLTLTEGRLMATIDHTEPQSWCYANGWTREQVWDLSNLTLMHRKCNAEKGDRRYQNGVLPPKPLNRFRYRRQKRAERAEVCTSCNAGRNLGEAEWCNSCGSGPMPERWPKWRQVDINECDHDLFFCRGCFIGDIPRRPVVDTLITGGNGYE